MWSLSARRVWIEIGIVQLVALAFELSLSARRVWIEMLGSPRTGCPGWVALRKESVDRNS